MWSHNSRNCLEKFWIQSDFWYEPHRLCRKWSPQVFLMPFRAPSAASDPPGGHLRVISLAGRPLKVETQRARPRSSNLGPRWRGDFLHERPLHGLATLHVVSWRRLGRHHRGGAFAFTSTCIAHMHLTIPLLAFMHTYDWRHCGPQPTKRAFQLAWLCVVCVCAQNIRIPTGGGYDPMKQAPT